MLGRDCGSGTYSRFCRRLVVWARLSHFLYKRERLERLRQIPALKLFYTTACKSDFHVRGTAFGSMFSGGGQVLAYGLQCKEQAPWRAQVLRGPQAQPDREVWPESMKQFRMPALSFT